jgi:hypothetical protein
MSADNWTECPRCIKSNPCISFTVREGGTNETLREDWEVGMDGDIFTMHYKCVCRVYRWCWEKNLSINVLQDGEQNEKDQK